MARIPAGGARDQLAFLLVFVPYLLDRERVTVAEAAAHFEMPEERIRSAARLIAVSGVPGETRSYQHEDLFDIDWGAFEDDDEIVLTHRVALDETPRFSAREAAALLTGLQSLSSAAGDDEQAMIGRVMAKLAQGSTVGGPSELAVQRPAQDDLLARIRRAIAEQRQIEVDYRGARGVRERRTIDPLLLENIGADWFLRGWCHLREGARTFRLDRMSDLTVTERAAPRHVESGELPSGLFRRDAGDLIVTVQIDVNLLPLIDAFLDSRPESPPEAGPIRVELRAAHPHGIKRLIASLGGAAEVLAPADVREAVAEWSRQALESARTPRSE